MAIYSEDNPNVSSSILLSSLLNIIFMDGAEQITKLVVSNDNIDKLLFIDAIPDSKRVNINYNNCIRLIKQNNLENKIHLVPVVCVEYYIINSILSLGLNFDFKYNWYSIVLKAVVKKRTIAKPFPPHIEYKYKGNFDSFEQQCKTLLYGTSSVFANYNVVNSKHAAELNSISYFLNETHGLTLYDKVVNLAKQYPVVRFKDEVPDGFRLVKDIVRKTTLLQNDYENWKSSFKKIRLQDKWWEDNNIDYTFKQMDVL